MKKHLVLKASILLIVMFFHSFVLVPKANAYLLGADMGPILFRSVPPSVVAAAASNTALVLGIPLAVGMAYLIYKSGAITAMKNWMTAQNLTQSVLPTVVGGQVALFNSGTGWHFRITFGEVWMTWRLYQTPPGGSEVLSTSTTTQSTAQSWMNMGTVQPIPLPTTTQNYTTQMAASPPSIPANTVYGSPGASKALTGVDYGIQVSWMSDAAVGALLEGLGATPIDPATGAQANVEGATPNDNTTTSGDAQQIGLMQSMLNYLTNLTGIKTDTAGIKTAIDNSVGVLQQISGKLDNVGGSTFPQAAQNALDNIAIGTNTEIAKLDNVIQAVSTVSATGTTVQTRIDSLKIAASTKFPFSLASSLSVSAVSGASTYDFAPLPLTPTISVQINPMSGPLGDLFVWIRQMLVWLFWVGTLFAILKTGMQM